MIDSPLPGILRWFEVVNTSVEEVPPVQFACETVQNANCKLNQLVSTYVTDPKRNVNPLSMRLQVSVLLFFSLFIIFYLHSKDVLWTNINKEVTKAVYNLKFLILCVRITRNSLLKKNKVAVLHNLYLTHNYILLKS